MILISLNSKPLICLSLSAILESTVLYRSPTVVPIASMLPSILKGPLHETLIGLKINSPYHLSSQNFAYAYYVFLSDEFHFL